jgi:hypothetical protein
LCRRRRRRGGSCGQRACDGNIVVNGGPSGDPVARLAIEVASLRRAVSELGEKVDGVDELRREVEAPILHRG